MDDRIISLEQVNKCIKFVDKNLIQFDKGGQGSVFKLEQKDCGLAVVKTYNDIETKSSKEAMTAEVNALLMIKKIIPAPTHHALEFEDAGTLKNNLRAKLTDELGPEARTAFEFAIKMLNAVYHE